jgi:site-specific DNA-methyltransferase (adenine-specific)
MQNEILTVKDLNRYLPAIKTNEDMAFTNKLHEGLFLADPIDGLANIPDESIDLIITEPTMQPKSNSLSGKSPTFENYVDWVDGWLEESKRVLTPNGSIYIICPWQSSSMYHSVLEKKFNVNLELLQKENLNKKACLSGRIPYQIFGLLQRPMTIFSIKIIL